MTGSILALAGLLGMVALCGVAALKDGLSWWAMRERARTSIGEKQA